MAWANTWTVVSVMLFTVAGASPDVNSAATKARARADEPLLTWHLFEERADVLVDPPLDVQLGRRGDVRFGREPLVDVVAARDPSERWIDPLVANLRRLDEGEPSLAAALVENVCDRSRPSGARYRARHTTTAGPLLGLCGFASRRAPLSILRSLARLRPLVAAFVEPTLDVVDAVANMSYDPDSAGSLSAGAPSVDRRQRNGEVRREILGAEQRSAQRAARARPLCGGPVTELLPISAAHAGVVVRYVCVMFFHHYG